MMETSHMYVRSEPGVRVSSVTVRKRLLFVLLFGVIIFFIIDTRLGYVQFIMGEKLTSLAKDS